MENVSTTAKEDEQIELPPGFRFHPTDEELITHYLSPKVLDANFSTVAIGEVDLNKCEPWDLPCEFLLKSIFTPFFFFCVALFFLFCSNSCFVCVMKGELKWVRRNGISSVLETESTQQV